MSDTERTTGVGRVSQVIGSIPLLLFAGESAIKLEKQ